MKRPFPYLHWLALAALADWLIMRTVTRSAIFMPKSPLVISIYEALNWAGQFAVTLGGLLTLVTLGWMAWQCWQAGRLIGWALVWAGLLALSVIFLFVMPTGWLAVGYQLLLLAVMVMIGKRLLIGKVVGKRVAWLLPALALIVGGVYQLIPVLYEALRWPGPPSLANPLFNLGELLITLSPVAWWYAYGRGASRKIWLVGALPALAFVGMRLGSANMTGTIAIWSAGLTLYLPWPLYAISLWLAGVTVITLLRRGDSTGWIILLLIASGYAPQLSTQAFLGLIALWLATWRADTPVRVEATLPVAQPTFAVTHG
ncbi:MAG: hypothetical protein IT324_08355 [Anaerolineae bacterium]|nr:hypothetical protein [Anaerolineae bacterium]